jgi:hypothetical protein
MAAVDPGQAGAIPGPGNTRSLDDAGPSSHQPPPFQGPLTPKPSPIQKAVAEAKAALAKSAAEPTTTAEGEDALTAAAEATGLSRATTDTIAYARQLRAAGRSDEEIRQALRANSSEPAVEATLQALNAAPGAAAEADDPLVVEIRPGVKLAVDDAETAAELRNVVGAATAAEEMQARDLERVEFEYLLEHDRVGLFLQLRPEDRAVIAAIAQNDPEVRAILDRAEFDPTQLAVNAVKRWQATQAEARHVTAAKQQAQVAVRAVESMIPPDMPDERAELMRDDLLRDLADAVRRNRSQLPPLEKLPEVLAVRLGVYGVDLDSAAARLAAGQARSFRHGSAGPTADEARGTGARLKAASAARREAAAVPGAGAGARPAKMELPAKQGVRERIAALRQQFGL